MADTNITWNGTPIDNIERDSLSLNRINENGTIREMVDTINANFLNIAKHGGGPAGMDGSNGSNGVDGSNVEYIYALCDEMNPDVQYPTDTYERANLFNSVKSAGHYTYKGVTWFDNARPISPEHKNEYVWSRIKRGAGLSDWYYASEPVLWAHWGETGQDGDGVEYIFLASSNELTSISLESSLLKIENMDDFQKVIFNMDDFYPGKDWFKSGENKKNVRTAISKKGLVISDSDFDTRWGQYFNFCDDTYSWTDEPTGTGPSVLYEYVSIRKSTKDENDIKIWGDFSTPALWSNYNLPTKTAIIYCNLDENETPKPPKGGWFDMSKDKLVTDKVGYELTPKYWKDTNEDAEENQITWMCTGVFEHTGENVYWSSPVRITGKDGKNGEDGTLIEFIYTLTTYGKEPEYPSISDKENLDKLFYDVENSTESPKYVEYHSTKWYDRAQPISVENPVEYMAQRSKQPDETEWTYTEPIIWSHWGEDGTDGDGVEYIFATTVTNSNSSLVLPVYSSLNDSQKKIFQIDDFYPDNSWFTKTQVKNGITTYPNKEKVQKVLGDRFDETEWNNYYGFNVSSGWSDNPVEVGPSALYQWVSIRRSYADEKTGGKRFWEDFSTPVLWNSYGQRTRTFIVYCNMPNETTPELPTGGWWDTTKDALWMSKTNENEYKSNALSPDKTPDYTSNVGYWSDNNIDVSGTITWISTGEFSDSIDDKGSNNISWSAPFRITGETGRPGADGSTIEFVYCLSEEMPAFPSGEIYEEKCNFFESVENAKSDSDLEHNGYVYTDSTGHTSEWFDNPQGISNEDGKRREWVWSRNKSVGDPGAEWTFPPKPVIWSHWGEDGTDGDGVEYMFLLGNFDTYNSPTENEWNTFFTLNFTGDNVSDIAKYVYATSDFLPTSEWFNNSNSSAIQKRMEADGKTFDATVWDSLKDVVYNRQLGTWKDNPENISETNKYQYVSIRKMNNGVWGTFSYPKLWSKYAIIKFKSIAFAATTFDIDLSGCTVTGGDFSKPLPTLTKNGDQIIDVTWKESPEPDALTGKTQIWMTSADVTEGDESPLVWTTPQKMTDTADFQVEWSSTDKTLEELVSINQSLSATDNEYNFGTLLKVKEYNENAAELAWRAKMLERFNISFDDNAENAILMATCQLKNGVWTDWTITRVKGEKGDTGTSINIKGKIVYESYLTSGTEYNYDNANNGKGTYTPSKNPENGDLLIVYPAEPNENGIYYGDALDGGKLYMWKYTNNEWKDYNSNSIGEETGNTYTSPNSHLILWDGDSWQDLGSIVGPEGKSYTIAVKYANELENGDKIEITDENEIPNAKWIGICVYEKGTTPPDIKTADWKWSHFKGQDGYGYEYIFKATKTKNSIPNIPQMPSGGNWHTTPNIVPADWTDDPIEPTQTDRYIWMCWRKFDHATQQWTDFMGAKDSTKAKLWHFYVTDGKPGAPGNGYKYYYARYENSSSDSYGKYTMPILQSYASTVSNPVFLLNNTSLPTSSNALGADDSHTFEYRTEQFFDGSAWSNWSEPITIAKYLDESIINKQVDEAVTTATSTINTNLNKAVSRLNTISGYFDEDGNLKTGITEGVTSTILSGYATTNDVTKEIESISLGGLMVDESGTETFSTWYNSQNSKLTDITTRMEAAEGILTQAVTTTQLSNVTTAFENFKADTQDRFAKIDQTVANEQYLTDDEGYLLVDELESTTWYSKKSYLGNTGTTTWIMSKVLHSLKYIYKCVPEVDSVDDLHNYNKSKWMIILRKNFDFTNINNNWYYELYTSSGNDGLSKYITVHLNKNTGKYTIETPKNVSSIASGFYNPFTSSNVEPGIVIYAVVDFNTNSYTSEDGVNYTLTNLSWNVGLSDGYTVPLSNTFEKLEGYAYAKNNNIFKIPIYQYKDTSDSSCEDVIMHAELYGHYGYSLAVDKSGKVYRPKVAGVSALEDNPVYFASKSISTGFTDIWNYLRNGTIPNATEIDDIMLGKPSEYYVLKHFSNPSNETYSYTLDVTDNLKNNDKNEVKFKNTISEPIFQNTHYYLSNSKFINDNGYRKCTYNNVTTSTTCKDQFTFLTTSNRDTINITISLSCNCSSSTSISVTVKSHKNNNTINIINETAPTGAYTKTINSKSIISTSNINPYTQLNFDITLTVSKAISNVDFKYKIESSNYIDNVIKSWTTDGYTRTTTLSQNTNIIDLMTVTIADRSIIEKINENNRKRALDNDGYPTKNYIDVCDSDRDKLIPSITELASISQMVSNGIAATSIVTSAGGNQAIFTQQADGDSSKIFMEADVVGIKSNYFNLNSSGLEMTGNLFAKDENGIITAGVIGDNTTDNDIKFFAGTNAEMQDRSKAPFRVFEDGSLYAGNGVFGGYVRMPYTFISDLVIPGDINYHADERAYIFCDQSPAADVALLLPNPTLDLNGFTYHIIAPPNIATRVPGQNYGLTIKTVNGYNYFDVYTSTVPIYNVSTLCCFGGHIEITCVPTAEGSEYKAKWIVTQCTGGVDCKKIQIPTITISDTKWNYNGLTYHLKSPTIAAGKETWCQINFKITNSIKSINITMRASTKSNNSVGYICKIDGTPSTTSYEARVYGSNTVSVPFTPDVGNHFVMVGYMKDLGNKANDDCVYVDITGVESLEVSICTLTGVSYEENNVVTKVMAQEVLPGSAYRSSDTIYIQR